MTATLLGPPPATEPAVAASGVRVVASRRPNRAERDPEPVRILGGVDLAVPAGAAVGIVAETGAGAGTLLRVLAGMCAIDAGQVRIAGHDLAGLSAHQRQAVHRLVQYVDADVAAGFDPTRSIGRAIRDVLRDHGRSRRTARAEARELADRFGLGADLLAARPAQLGDEALLRAGLARCMAIDPETLLLHDPFRRLDHGARRRLVAVLAQLRAEGVTVVVSGAEPAWLGRCCDTLVVLTAGRIVEVASTADLIGRPRHPLTRALIGVDPAVGAPSWQTPITGCVMAGRCPRVRERCVAVEPHLHDPGVGHAVACHFAESVADGLDAAPHAAPPTSRAGDAT